ncbi:MAG TPA: hypothetical protein VK151_01000 [Fluviicola sp.]|nr:hypothetical protein [Fluviicola sp.]
MTTRKLLLSFGLLALLASPFEVSATTNAAATSTVATFSSVDADSADTFRPKKKKTSKKKKKPHCEAY